MTNAEVPFVDWLVARLRQRGTKRFFGVPGGGTSLDLIDAARRHDIDLVLTAREDAAVIMAGVTGVLAEAPGLAFSTKGPGLTSASNGLASAALDRMPALLVSETFGPGELDYVSHQVFDQPALVTPILRKGDGEVIGETVEAVEDWLIQQPQPIRRPAAMFPDTEALRRKVLPTGTDAPPQLAPVPSAKELEAVVERLAASLNPVVILGLEAARPAIATEVRRVVEVTNAVVLSTYMAAGTIPHDHPNYAGIFTGGAVEQTCVNEADLIVLIGLDPVELIRKPWTYKAPVIDLCEVARSPHYLIPDARLVGPLAASLREIHSRFSELSSGSSWAPEQIAEHRAYFHRQLAVGAEDGLSSEQVIKSLADAFGSGPRLAVDAGAHMFSACAFWPAQQPRDILISNGLASMGFAVPAGIAAALHEPSRGAVAVTGDGGIMMCLGELKTAAATGAEICIVVFNDGRLSLIDIKREERQMTDLGLSWRRPDFAAVAGGFGFTTWRVETSEELATACAEAATARGPRLIDAVIDSSGYFMQMKSLRG